MPRLGTASWFRDGFLEEVTRSGGLKTGLEGSRERLSGQGMVGRRDSRGEGEVSNSMVCGC